MSKTTLYCSLVVKRFRFGNLDKDGFLFFLGGFGTKMTISHLWCECIH